MFITGRKHFDEYSQWLFSVLFELEKRVKPVSYTHLDVYKRQILDRTLRDKIRTERITGGTVIGAYPKESQLRYRRYNKAINEMAVKQLSTALLPHLNTQEQRVVNLLRTCLLYTSRCV